MPQRRLPLAAFRFQVEIGGLTAGGFSDVSGLQVETETFDYREGGENGFIHKLAGPARYSSNLVLKRGIADTTLLWDWLQQVTKGTVTRKQCAVHLMDEDGNRAVSWNFRDAYPVKWSGPELRGDSNSVAVESIELAHHGISVAVKS